MGVGLVQGGPGGAGAALEEEGHACWYIKTFAGIGQNAVSELIRSPGTRCSPLSVRRPLLRLIAEGKIRYLTQPAVCAATPVAAAQTVPWSVQTSFARSRES